MWLRITGAAVVFAVWRRPWRLGQLETGASGTRCCLLGIVLAGMNAMFYLAIARLPLATVGATEFLGTVVLAAFGEGPTQRHGPCPHHRRSRGADRHTGGRAAALASCSRSATAPASWPTSHRRPPRRQHRRQRQAVPRERLIDQLAAAMIIAAVIAAPAGLGGGAAGLHPPGLAGRGASAWGSAPRSFPTSPISSPWPPLPRASFALLLALLPAVAVARPARPFSARSPPPGTWPASRWSIAGVAIHRPGTRAADAIPDGHRGSGRPRA